MFYLKKRYLKKNEFGFEIAITGFHFSIKMQIVFVSELLREVKKGKIN